MLDDREILGLFVNFGLEDQHVVQKIRRLVLPNE
jgi:hypothetical protein